MAETPSKKLEREYVIPLRRAWLNVPVYERTGKAIKAIKKFIAKHMKVADRNVDNVKLDVYLNNELWFRGRANPPSRVKVKAIKEGDIVHVKFAETPQYVKFLQLKHSRIHNKAESKSEAKAEVKAEEKTTEEKKDESEKEKAVEQQNIKQAEQQVKAQKHTTSPKEQKINRMALKK